MASPKTSIPAPLSAAVGGFILAAGEGKRLRPATLATPKAAVPFCGVPLVCLARRKFSHIGCLNIAVNTHYLAEQVTGCIREERHLDGTPLPQVHVSQEESLLNTGGGLRQGCGLLPDAGTILVHNADVITDFPLEDLLRIHLKKTNLATVLLIPGQGPCTVKIDDTGQIVSFREPAAANHHTFSGVYVFQRSLLDYLPDRPAPSIVEAMEAALRDGKSVFGLLPDAPLFWSDLGTPASYIDAHAAAYRHDWSRCPVMNSAVHEQQLRLRQFRRKGIRISGGTAVGENVAVAAGSVLHDCILWNGITIPEPTALAGGILTTGTYLAMPPPRLAAPSGPVLKTLELRPDECTLTDLEAQGSGRRYARLKGAAESWIWSWYSHARQENAFTASCSRFLARCGVRVPGVRIHRPDTCELVVEDLGDLRLQDVKDTNLRTAVLNQAMEQIARLHVTGPAEFERAPMPLQPPFDANLYTWERTYFREETLQAYFNCPKRWTAAVENECLEGQNRLLRAPQTIVHRDFQSANIMVTDGQAVLIDFQGMRFGVAAYDLASLIFDPYVCRTPEEQTRMWEHYCRTVEALEGIPPGKDLLTAAAVQRLLQALGAYGKLWLKDGREWFADHIRPGLEMLRQATADSTAYAHLNLLMKTLLAEDK